MNKKNMVQNASWIIGCKLVKAVLTLLVTMLTARYLGASNYGLINYAASLVAFVTPIMKLGLDGTLVYEIINDSEEEESILGTAVVCNMISSLLCIVGILSFVSIVNHGERDTFFVCLIYSTLLFFQAIEMVQYWFQSKLLSKYTSLAMVAAYVIVTIVQIVFLAMHKNVYWIAATYVLEYVVLAGLLIAVLNAKFNMKLHFSWSLARRMINRSKYYILSGLMITIFNQTDKIMIKAMLDNAAVGYYSAATTCATMTSFVFVAIIDSVRPSVLESRNDNQKLEQRMKTLYNIIIYLSLIQCVLYSTLSPIIIRILYGTQYTGAVDALRIIAWFTTFSYLGTVRDVWILAKEKQRYLWRINLAGALANVVLNYILIPHFGILGASAASLATQFFTNVIVGFIIKAIRPNNRIMIGALNPVLLTASFKSLKNGLRKKAG